MFQYISSPKEYGHGDVCDDASDQLSLLISTGRRVLFTWQPCRKPSKDAAKIHQSTSAEHHLSSLPHLKSTMNSPRAVVPTVTPSCLRAAACLAAPPGPLFPTIISCPIWGWFMQAHLGDIMPLALITRCQGTFWSWKK